jgi:hypothetical protein
MGATEPAGEAAVHIPNSLATLNSSAKKQSPMSSDPSKAVASEIWCNLRDQERERSICMDSPFFSLEAVQRKIQAGKAQIHSVGQRLCLP